MTQQEFEQRTGTTVLIEEFKTIHELYMNTPYDKDRFCKIWKEDVEYLRDIANLHTQLEENIRQKSQMADFIIQQSEKYSSAELRFKAIEMLGEKEYLRRKIEKCYNLWEEDRELLNDILS